VACQHQVELAPQGLNLVRKTRGRLALFRYYPLARAPIWWLFNNRPNQGPSINNAITAETQRSQRNSLMKTWIHFAFLAPLRWAYSLWMNT